MRGSSNVRKYVELVRATPVEGTSEYSRDYRASVIDTLEWMLGERKERPIALAKQTSEKKKAVAEKPKRVSAPRKRPASVPRAFPKAQQVQA
jgi:hypothetical protein